MNCCILLLFLLFCNGNNCNSNESPKCECEKPVHPEKSCCNTPPWTRSGYSNGDTCGCEEK